MNETTSDTLNIYSDLVTKKKIEDIKEAYAFACPRRYPSEEKKEKNLTDSTAITALSDKTNEMHGQIYPPFRQWINLVPETPIPDSEKENWQKHKKDAEQKMSMALEMSNFHLEIDEVLTDAAICEGALLLHEGTAANPFIFEEVPWDKFVTKLSFDKRPETNFLLREIPLAEIKYRWPKAENLETIENGDKNRLVKIVDAMIYNDFKDTYTYEVWLLEERKIIFRQENLTSSPWNVYRFNKKMMSKTGYGPVQEVLPDIKTVNRAQELVLQNGAMAITGMWQAEDDGVLNPSTVKIVPGAIIPKAAGSKGLQPLETNRNFDVSQIIISDRQEKIKKSIKGDSLPDPKSGIRTAYEFSARKEESAKTEVPSMLRLAQPNSQLGRRMYDILTSDSKKDSPYYIKPFAFTRQGEDVETVVKVRMANPLIDLQKEVDAQKELQALGNAISIFGDLPLKMIKKVEYCHKYMVDNGFDIQYLESVDTVKKNINAEQQALMQAKGQALAQEEQKQNGH